MTLIVAPPSCYQPEAVQGEGRVWGPTVQLYGLRSRRNWGIGDFGDLRALVDLSAEAGGGSSRGQSPACPVPGRPCAYQPLQPVQPLLRQHSLPRRGGEFRNSPSAMQREISLPPNRFQARLRRLRASEQVAYEEVSAAKREVLAMLYRHFRDHHLANDSDRARAFRLFPRGRGRGTGTPCTLRSTAGTFPARESRLSGAGRPGPRNTAIRKRRQWRHSRPNMPMPSNSLSGCSGWPTSSSPPWAGNRVAAAWASASIRIWRWV